MVDPVVVAGDRIDALEKENYYLREALKVAKVRIVSITRHARLTPGDSIYINEFCSMVDDLLTPAGKDALKSQEGK